MMRHLKTFTDSYLGKPRLFFFLLTMNLSGATVGLSSWALSVGIQNEKQTAAQIPGGYLNIRNIVGAGGAVVAASGVASLLCFWLLITQILPFKRETKSSVWLKEATFGFACILWIATLIPATYITAVDSGVITAPGIPPAFIAAAVAAAGENLAYNSQRSIISYLVVGWITFLSTLVNLVLVSLTARHMLKRHDDEEANALAISESHQTHDQVHEKAEMHHEKPANQPESNTSAA